MGDRTTVILTILTKQVLQAQEVIEHTDVSYVVGDLTEFQYYEVNYGELPFLDELSNAGIAYESYWQDGNEFTKGSQYCRFTPDGEVEITTVYDCDINPDLYKLLALIDKPDELREFILGHQERITALPWDNQEEYGKIHRAKKLIEGK